jgi:hypothetical protein
MVGKGEEMRRKERSKKYEERVQREYDKLITTYEDEGIQVAPGRFPISSFFAMAMATESIKESMGSLCPKRKFLNIPAADLDGIQVVRDVFIKVEGGKYFLEYHDSEQAEEYIEQWACFF